MDDSYDNEEGLKMWEKFILCYVYVSSKQGSFSHDGVYDLSTFSELSHDPTEAKLSYYREETLLHAFHTLFHKLYVGLK